MLQASDPEIKNLTSFLVKNPGRSIVILPSICRSILEKSKKINIGTFKRNGRTHPGYLNDTSGHHVPVSGFRRKNNNGGDPVRPVDVNSIDLAGVTYSFENTIEWDHTFEDDEDVESLHRWNWLVVKLSECHAASALKDWGTYHIFDWINTHMNGPRDSIVWEPYTTGERICNLLIFLEKTGLECDPYLKAALTVMASHVYRNLEYYGDKNTYNHIINNARALYYSGQYLGLHNYSEAAGEILRSELPKLVTEDGFLREGSSHYHFLFSRWILEILYVAGKSQDHKTISMVSPFAERLVRRCWFFLVPGEKRSEWNMPLIGDVSPDVAPEWLVSLPWSRPALSLYNPKHHIKGTHKRGWSLLFDDDMSEKHRPENQGLHRGDNIQAFGASGWYRFDFKGTTMFLHAEPGGIPAHPGHFHNDLGSFCLYREGGPVLVDTGRMHYINDDPGRFGLSARSHNSVQIDGLDPYPGGTYSEIWRAVCERPDITWLRNGNDLLIRIRHSGFSRLSNDRVVYVRVFRMSGSHMTIEDSFEGIREHVVETFFHWAEGLSTESSDNDRNFAVSGNDAKYIFESDVPENTLSERHYGSVNPCAGLYFPKYGSKRPIWTLKYKIRAFFPLKQSYRLQWN